MRICLIASSRFPIAEPFAGGLEAWAHSLAVALASRGHDLTLFAAPGSDPALPRMVAFGGEGPRFDVIHHASLHHLPAAMASSLPTPMVTTLHTPPGPWLESEVALNGDAGTFVSVSEVTARAWAPVVSSTVIRNGADLGLFAPGRGGGPAVWTGRLVREKAPHHAIDAARLAGVDIVLAGPASDPDYVEAEVRPRLGADARYAGHLSRRELAELLGSASVAVVTPEWDEPYGLVAAEAMACGTPVAAYARGALQELVVPSVGELAVPGDLGSLATAIQLAPMCDRKAVRAHAEQHCALPRMIDEYERLYASLARRRAA